MLEQIKFIENQLNELEEQITTMLFEKIQVITTVPGIGNILGAIIVGEIGNISRFDSASKLVVFAGLDASVKQSGNFIGTQNKISKRGSPYLGRAIWTTANRASFCDPVLSDYYQSLKARGKHHLKQHRTNKKRGLKNDFYWWSRAYFYDILAAIEQTCSPEIEIVYIVFA